MKRWIDAVKSNNLRPMQKNLRIVDQNFNQEIQFFCMKLEVALNWITDHSIYLSISPLIRKPKLFEAIWWWTNTGRRRRRRSASPELKPESRHTALAGNQVIIRTTGVELTNLPENIRIYLWFKGLPADSRSTNNILRWESSTSTFFFNMLQPSGLGNCYCCKWVSRTWDARKYGMLQNLPVSAALRVQAQLCRLDIRDPFQCVA